MRQTDKEVVLFHFNHKYAAQGGFEKLLKLLEDNLPMRDVANHFTITPQRIYQLFYAITGESIPTYRRRKNAEKLSRLQ